MEVQVEHLGNVQFEITAREHKILCDQPLDKGGDDEGMTPPELMLASLASCAAFYAAAYLKKQGLATEGTRVRLTAEKVFGPARLDNFKIEIDVPVDLSEQDRMGVDQAVHHCLIHNTLLSPPTIGIEVTSVVRVG
jgi:putative redox protein